MTDTPVNAKGEPPVSRLEAIKGFVGDLARPFAIITTSGAASASMIIMALRVENGNDAAILMAAIAALVGGIYGFKAWEAVKGSNNAASVEVAKAKAE